MNHDCSKQNFPTVGAVYCQQDNHLVTTNNEGTCRSRLVGQQDFKISYMLTTSSASKLLRAISNSRLEINKTNCIVHVCCFSCECICVCVCVCGICDFCVYARVKDCTSTVFVVHR